MQKTISAYLLLQYVSYMKHAASINQFSVRYKEYVNTFFSLNKIDLNVEGISGKPVVKEIKYNEAIEMALRIFKKNIKGFEEDLFDDYLKTIEDFGNKEIKLTEEEFKHLQDLFFVAEKQLHNTWYFVVTLNMVEKYLSKELYEQFQKLDKKLSMERPSGNSDCAYYNLLDFFEKN